MSAHPDVWCPDCGTQSHEDDIGTVCTTCRRGMIERVTMLRITYEHCGVEWVDEWSCACDSECPVCGADIEASEWEEIAA